MVSYVNSGLLNPYEPRPLQRRLTVPIVILALQEENQIAIISCAISPTNLETTVLHRS